MEITTGTPLARARSSSWRIISEANTLPPPLFTRSTMAPTPSCSAVVLISSASESPPIVPGGCSPGMILPWAVITATRSPSMGISSFGRMRAHIGFKHHGLEQPIVIAGTDQLHQPVIGLVAIQYLVDEARLQRQCGGVTTLLRQ